MKTQTYILILAFIIKFVSSTTTPLLETIDLELDTNKTFQIKSKEDEPLDYFLNPNSVRTIIPKKYFDLIKKYLEKNNFRCTKTYTYSGGVYELFYCKEKNGVDFSKIKLHLNFENYTLTMTEGQLFEISGSKHNSKLRTQSDTNMLIAGIAK